jgi:hypothetical protein
LLGQLQSGVYVASLLHALFRKENVYSRVYFIESQNKRIEQLLWLNRPTLHMCLVLALLIVEQYSILPFGRIFQLPPKYVSTTEMKVQRASRGMSMKEKDVVSDV